VQLLIGHYQGFSSEIRRKPPNIAGRYIGLETQWTIGKIYFWVMTEKGLDKF
jgi:hypothetical protein